MPWRQCSKMDERLRFVARLLEGEKMAELCREFPFAAKVLPMSSVLKVTDVSRTDRLEVVGVRGFEPPTPTSRT